MDSQINHIKHKIIEYKKKYYGKRLINGLILLLSIALITFLSITLLEYFGNFNRTIRKILFFTLLGIICFALYKHLFIPLKNYLLFDKTMSDTDASKEIGQFFPEIKDKLLNVLQLEKLNYSNNALVLASIEQKSQILEPFSFKNAIDFQESKKYLLFYLSIPVLLFFCLLSFNKQTLTISSHRLLHFNQEFLPEAPFQFQLRNQDLSVFAGDPLKIEVDLVGSSIPDQVYIVSDNGRILMNQTNSSFEHVFYNIQDNTEFWFEGAGYISKKYAAMLKLRPSLLDIEVSLDYPKYLRKANHTTNNIGNLSLPEGTKITWKIRTKETENVKFILDDSLLYIPERQNENLFLFNKSFKENHNYTIQLNNKFGKNKEGLQYSIETIKDKFPSVNLEDYKDTILFSYLLIGGNIGDDYGINQLKLFYRKISPASQNPNYQSLQIPFNKNSSNQNFVYQLLLDSLQLEPGDKVEYFVKVWDNDGVNGNKATRSRSMSFHIPSTQELEQQQEKNAESNKNLLSSSISQAESIQKELQKLGDELKTKRDLTWQDKKDIEKILQKQRKLQAELEALNEQVALNNEQKSKFQEQSPELKEKMAQLQQLMQQMVDPETKKLMDELQKLLNEESDIDEINKKLEELTKQEDNFEKELDRALEAYKQLEFENKLDQTIAKLEKLSDKQDQLKENTEKANSKEELTNLQKEQEELNKEFEDLQKELEKLDELNEQLENKHELEDLDKEEKNTKENLENSTDQLEKNNKKNASQSQKNASESMQKMAQKMKEMKQEDEGEMLEENIEDLTKILDNLIKLSFNQEQVMIRLSKLSQRDPLYVEYSQKQLNLQHDAEVLEDSLYSLAKRLIQIESIVTKEVNTLKTLLEESSNFIKQRNTSHALVKQQYAMTSMNNLALMLDEILDNLQSQMSQKSDGDQMCQKPGNKKGGQKGNSNPSMGEMQKQLNDMIKALKEGQKQGKSMSSELAKAAARQEMLRRGLQELHKTGLDGKENQKMSEELKKLEEIMEETEKDLLQNNITERTLNRQQDLLTRLLEAENATRERDLDEKRKATQASDLIKPSVPNYDAYLKTKQKQIELLQTVPPSLSPYYKKEVNEYFETIDK